MALMQAPAWASWSEQAALSPWTVGVEEEVMLLDPDDWTLAHRIDDVLPQLGEDLAARASQETHSCALEIRTGPHASAGGACGELSRARRALTAELAQLGLGSAVAGLHPFAVWSEIEVSGAERYQQLYGSMRELARREPTFALHVHVAVPDPETAIVVLDRLRAHLPLMLALSSNSPYWQGRDTGFASARTPLFQAFPRVGIPRSFVDYDEYVAAIDLLQRAQAIADPSYLWWDLRLQPRFGTVEVRIMDAQSTVTDTCALAALVQCLVRAEAEHPPEPGNPRFQAEVLIENRFLAARDGMAARLIDAEAACMRPADELLGETLEGCRWAAQELGCTEQLEGVAALGESTGASRQRLATEGGADLTALVATLAEQF